MASAPAATTPFEFPATLSVAIAAADGLLEERLSDLLTAVGCRLLADGGQGTADVLVSAHPRANTDVCAEIRERAKDTGDEVTILVVEEASTGDVRRALDAGAHAVVTEDSIESALVLSIAAVLAGQVVIPAKARRAGHPKVLTSREKQVLGLVVMGLTNAEIATKLFLAESTVKSHLSSAFSKLGVASRSEAAALILDSQSGVGLGILTIPSN